MRWQAAQTTCFQLQTLSIKELLPPSNIFRDTPAALGFLSELRCLRRCQSSFKWLDHQLPSFGPLSAAMQVDVNHKTPETLNPYRVPWSCASCVLNSAAPRIWHLERAAVCPVVTVCTARS